MKKIIMFIGALIVSAVIAFAVSQTLEQAVVIGVGGAMFIALVLGVFDIPAKRESGKFDTIRHYDGRKSYGQAAVFIGTACLFMGTPEQCNEMCQDLWHYGQQADVRQLTGEETEFNIL